MNRSTLRTAIIILTLITAGIHLYLNVRSGHFEPAFTANALGYLALMVALFMPPPFLAGMLKGRETLLHYVYMGFTAITIIAYFVISAQAFTDVLGLIAKADEVLLIVALWLHLRAS